MNNFEKILHGYDKDETMNKIGKLKIGDKLYQFNNNNNVFIKDIKIINYKNGIKIYNLTVNNGHTYFANGILVHNKRGCVIL